MHLFCFCFSVLLSPLSCSSRYRGDTQALVPLFAIGVFFVFTLSQARILRHWHVPHCRQLFHPRGDQRSSAPFSPPAATVIELVSKFTEGAWLIVLVIPLLVLLFTRIHLTYDQIRTRLLARPAAQAAAPG